MAAVLSFLVVLLLSLLVVRISGIALTVTGVPREVARFEARSAWSGTGFTTAQSESIVRHPVRRKIITILILLRNAGIVGASSTLILSFVEMHQSGQSFHKILILLGGMAALWFLAQNNTVDRWLSNSISWIIRRYTGLEHDKAFLLNLGGDYAIEELHVREGGWVAGKTLDDMALRKEGILVLGIDRAGKDYIGVPPADIRIEVDDNLILYGRSQDLKDLTDRQAGARGETERQEAEDRQHQQEVKQEQDAKS